MYMQAISLCCASNCYGRPTSFAVVSTVDHAVVRPVVPSHIAIDRPDALLIHRRRILSA